MVPYGQQILRNLVDENVNVGFVHEDLDHATGTAYVTAAHGKNAIVVVPSANYSREPKHLESAERFFSATGRLSAHSVRNSDECGRKNV